MTRSVPDDSVVMRRSAPGPGPSEEEHGLITEMFESMRGELPDLIPDLGKRLGYDGKAIQGNSTGRKRFTVNLICFLHTGRIACGSGKRSGTILLNMSLGAG